MSASTEGDRPEEGLAGFRIHAAACHHDLLKALRDVRQELWVDYCLHMGRTDCDPAPFNSRPHIRIIDEAIAKASA
jgi:hypothetical protein